MSTSLPTVTLLDGLSDDSISLEVGKHTIIQLDQHFGRDRLSPLYPSQPDTEFTIRMPDGVLPEDVQALLSTVIYSMGSQSRIEVLHWQLRIKGQSDALDVDLPYGPLDTIQGLRGIEFSNGTVWTADQVLDQLRQADHAKELLAGSSGNDLLRGDAQDRRLYGYAGQDTLVSGAGNEAMYGGDGRDVYRFAAGWGHDNINWGVGDTIEFGVGVTPAQLLVYRSGATLYVDDQQGNVVDVLGYFYEAATPAEPVIRFADGSSWSDADIRPRATALGAMHDDTFDGTAVSERYDGRAGNDAINGGGGNDTLVGGQGADTIGVALSEGAATGQTTIVQFQPGFGPDRIGGFDPTVQKLKLEFLGGLKSTDITVTRLTQAGADTNDALIAFNGTADSVRVTNLFAAIGAASNAALLVFSDGVSLTASQVLAKVSGRLAEDYQLVLTGTSGQDILTAGLANTVFDAAGGGNDTLQAGSLFDSVNIDVGRAGVSERDTLQLLATRPDQVIGMSTSGGEGGVMMRLAGITSSSPSYVISWIDIAGMRAGGTLHPIDLKFADGTVWNEQQIEQRLLAGKDQADDSIYLLASRAETIDLHAGRGHDTLSAFQSGNAANPDDLIQASSKDVSFARVLTPGYYYSSGSHGGGGWIPGHTDVVVKLNATGDSVTLSYFDVVQGGTARIVGFADGTGLTSGDIFTLLAQPPGPGLPQPHLPGQAVVGTIFNDTLQGTTGDDTLAGGQGDDALDGGTGYDTAVFNLGDGRDALVGKFDTLKLGAGLNAVDAQYGNNRLSFKGLADAIGMTTLPETIAFADGTRWHAADVLALQYLGTGFNDNITGDAQGNSLFGQAGDDVLIGGLGLDTLTGGQGNDAIYTGTNAGENDGVRDIVVFNRGDGEDQVWATGDILQLGAGLTRENLSVTQMEYGGLRLRFADTADTIYLTDQPSAPRTAIAFADGSVLSDADLTRLLSLGTMGNDFLAGGDQADSLDGLAGHDKLNGNGGNDTLTGGLGNDTLVGGAGIDHYLYGRGDGLDTLVVDAQDTIDFKAGIVATDLSLATVRTMPGYGEPDGAAPAQTLLSIKGQADALVLEGTSSASGPSMAFSNGTGLSWAALQAAPVVVQGSALSQAWTTGSGNDTLAGGLGRDTLDGGAGKDTYLYNKGDGNDLVRASGADTIVLGGGLKKADLTLARVVGNPDAVALVVNNSQDSLIIGQMSQWSGLTVKFSDGSTYTGAQLTSGSSGKLFGLGQGGGDTLTGGSGNDILRSAVDFFGTTLVGGAGNDVLQGNYGMEWLYGDAGADTLGGGAGSDHLVGGKGGDTYVFNRGDEYDIVTENDTTFLNSALTPDLLKVGDAKSNQLWFTKSDNNLQIAIIGTRDVVTIENWYRGSNYQVEKITALGDNKSLSASKVNALVTAMAKFTAPAEGVTTLPAATQAGLSKILASSWA